MEKQWVAEVLKDTDLSKALSPKLSVPQQVEDLKRKGIKFEIMSEADARRFLSHNNYYFKLKAYCKNYSKDTDGKYQGVDFAYLVDLSTIDMHLRKLIIKISLDVEHFLKVSLLRDFLLAGDEDGYKIVDDFFQMHPEIKREVIEKGKSSYCAEMIEHYKDHFAIWNIVEVLSFGHFAMLYEWFYMRHPTFRDNLVNMLLPVKSIRNAAAHNNCLINKMSTSYNVESNQKVNQFISQIPKISGKTRQKKLSNPVIHDFAVLLYTFDKVVSSPKTKEHIYNELKDLFDNRIPKHREYYYDNAILTSSYEFVKKIVDFLSSSCI